MLGCRAQQGALVPGDIYGAIRKRKKLSKGTGYAVPAHLGVALCTHIPCTDMHTQHALHNNIARCSYDTLFGCWSLKTEPGHSTVQMVFPSV